MRNLVCIVLIAFLAVTATGQQIADNTAGHALTSDGNNPVVGAPIELNTFFGTEDLNLELSAAPGAGIILGVSTALAATSIPVGAGLGNEIDLDLTFVTLLFDFNNPFAPLNFLSTPFISNAGTNAYSFPISSASAGLTPALQAALQDPAEPVGLGLTASEQWSISNVFEVIMTGDENTVEIDFLNNPVLCYGNTYTSFEVSTNGWIKLGTSATNADFSDSVSDFIGGLTGGGVPAPVFAPLWEDLNMIDADGGRVRIYRAGGSGDLPGDDVLLNIDWENFQFFNGSAGMTLGTFRCQFCYNFIGTALDLIDFEYNINGTNMAAEAEMDALVGISSGGTATNPIDITEHDFVSFGTKNPLSPVPGSAPTIYQDFGGAMFGEIEDLDGQNSIRFFDVSSTPGNGTFDLQ